MAAWRVDLTPAAARQLRRASAMEAAAIRGVILALANDPWPSGAAKLRGRRGLWRIRVRVDGRAWRVVYQLRDADRLIIVTRVAARDEGTYRGV